MLDECWVDETRYVMKYRVAYTILIGPPPEGKHLHHRCRQHCCYNPWHLIPLTPDEHRAEHANDPRPEQWMRRKRRLEEQGLSWT